MDLAALILAVMALLCGVASLSVSCVFVGMSRGKPAAADEVKPAEMEDKEEARRSKEIDEGFDALMRFSVNGHDGFDDGGFTI